MQFSITLASVEHVDKIREIERVAASQYSVDQLPEPLRSSCIPVADLEKGVEEERLFVALLENNTAVGHAFALKKDGVAFLAQTDVHPDYQRQGVGRSLLERVCLWAEENGFPEIWLTTFDNVPCNRPFYEKSGFTVMKDQPSSVKETLQREEEAGLRNRVAMCRALSAGHGVNTPESGPAMKTALQKQRDK